MDAPWKRLLGPWPPTAVLEPRVVESVDCGPYTREKVVYAGIPAYVCAQGPDRARAYDFLLELQ